MRYLVISKIPARQRGLFTDPEKVTIDEHEEEGDDAIEKIKDKVYVPLYGFVLIVKEEDVTKVTSKIIKEIA